MITQNAVIRLETNGSFRTFQFPGLAVLFMAFLSACGMRNDDNTAADAAPTTQAVTSDEGSVVATDGVRDHGLILPYGFEATVVFEGTSESRELYIRDDGDMFVSLSGLGEGPHILGLRDEDGDHVIDTVTRFFDVTTPESQLAPRVHIEYHNGYLYAVTNEQLVRMPLPNGTLSPTGEVEIVVENIPYQSGHRARTLSIDPDGWVYVNIGSPSNVCQEKTKTKGSPGIDPCPQLEAHAGIWRWRGDVFGQSREDGEHYAEGLRNTIAQTWDEVYDGLHVAQMGRDRLDSLWPEMFNAQQNADLPAEEFFRVEKGQKFGWPYCYYDPFKKKKVLAPEYGGDGEIVGRCSQYEKPLVAFPAHYSPSSIAFYHADQFPKRYRSGAFVALKGSWNRAPLPQDGYIVAFIPFTDGVPAGEWEVFADGFKGFDILYERGNAVYRPQSVAVHPDGSIYILDNNKGRIWRVSYHGEKARRPVKVTNEPTSDRQLIVESSLGEGAQLYTQYCASCHQPGGGGVPGEFPPLSGVNWVAGDKGRLIRAVLHGMQGPININGELYDEIMPAHDFLDDEELAVLLTYLRKMFGSGDPVHESEVLLVRNADQRDAPWEATELETMTGIPGLRH